MSSFPLSSAIHRRKRIDSIFSWVFSVTGHRRRQNVINVVKTSVTHSPVAQLVDVICHDH